MSLTGMLAKRGEPLRELFEARLPNCKPMQDAWRLNAQATIVPSGPVSWGLVGAAFDYRLRYLFVETPVEQFVAALGSASREDLRSSFLNLARDLTSFIAETSPVGRELPPDAESRLARYCYVLAMYEALFRAPIARSPLFELPPDAPSARQLELAPDLDIVDLSRLIAAAKFALGPLVGRPMIANPTFAGSLAVGGADADLIIDGCLIDIKTTKNKSLDRDMAYQIVGYLLLDYEDEFAINRIGFYASRAPVLLEWLADEAISTMSNGHETRESLRLAIQQLLPAPRLPRVPPTVI